MKKPPGFCHMVAARASEALARKPVNHVTKSPGKSRAKSDRAEKLAKALRANLARRKQAPAAEGEAAGSEADDRAYRRRDDDLAPLGGKSGRRK